MIRVRVLVAPVPGGKIQVEQPVRLLQDPTAEELGFELLNPLKTVTCSTPQQAEEIRDQVRENPDWELIEAEPDEGEAPPE